MHTSQQDELKTYRFLDNASFALTVVALESGKVLYANRRILNLFEIPLDQPVGRLDQNYLINQEQYEPLIQKLKREGQITDQELHLKTWQGRPIWILMSANLVTFAGHAAFQAAMFDITQRKQTETALLESEDRFRTLFEQAAVGVALLETQTGRFVRINQKYCDFLGYTMEEMLQKRFQDVTYPEDIRENEENNAKLIKGDIFEFSLDKRYMRKDGGIVWGNLTGSVLWRTIEHAHGYYHIAVVQDITERKRMEELLKFSNERFDLAVKAAKMGVWDWDIPKNEMTWNDQMYELYGVKKTDFGGAYDAWLKGVHPEDIVFSDEAVRAALRGEREYDTEFRIIHPDGSLRYIKAYGLVVQDAEDTPLHFIGIDYDITERKQALRESEEKFRSLFEGHSSIMLQIEPDTGRILDANPSASSFYGYSHAELLQMNIADINPLHPNEIKARVKEAEQRKMNYFIFPHRLANGEIRTVQVNSSTILVKGVGNLFSIINDITEQKKMEAELIESQKLAVLGTLAAGVAHEINTPLQIITGITEDLQVSIPKKEVDEERLLQKLGIVNRNGWRIAKIVRSLLTYARAEPEEMEANDLNNIVSETERLMDHQLKVWANIQVEMELAEDIPPVICNSGQIGQAIIILLTNAKDAMPSGGKITIRTGFKKGAEERVFLQFADTGTGIPEEVRSRIFDPFFTTKAKGEGTGLGLSILTGIVGDHGAELEVDSQKGAGTTFTIILKPAYDSRKGHS
ncbi:MAG: PAS domain S-box protein [Leptolinea sp.]